jgi:hypothetical protein
MRWSEWRCEHGQGCEYETDGLSILAIRALMVRMVRRGTERGHYALALRAQSLEDLKRPITQKGRSDCGRHFVLPLSQRNCRLTFGREFVWRACRGY